MEKYLLELGLSPAKRYTPDEIKSAWKKLCKKHHPDAGGKKEDFERITHAYNMLTDPSYRSENDSKDALRQMDLHVRMQVPVSFEQAFFGCDFNLNYNRETMDDGGKLIKQDHYEIESLRISVPPKSCHGATIGFPNKGIRRGDKVGSVEVIVIVHPHSKFRVDENHDVHSIEKIPLDVMIKGGSLSVPTMFGIKTLKLKPGTRPGERIKMRGLGFCDHIITCDPLFPTEEDLRKESWSGMNINWKIKDEVDEEEAKYQQDFRNMRNSGIFTFTTNGGSGTGGFI